MVPPPTDLDRLRSAWLSFQNLANVNLPALRLRAFAVQTKVNRGSLPPPPRKF